MERGQSCPGGFMSLRVETGTLTATGTWLFELRVTDSSGTPATVISNAVTVTVNSALIAPVVSVSPTTIYAGQGSTLSTTTSFSGGTSPYTCQWLVKIPSSGSYTSLGASFSCAPGDEPTASTGALSAIGTWNFELQVTDGSGTPVTVISDAVTVTVNPGPTQPILVPTPSGGSAFTYTVSGCSVSPASGTSGVTTDFAVDPSCTLTVTMPSAGVSTRYVFDSSASSTTIDTCFSGTCSTFSPTDYYQILYTLSYSVVDGGSPTAPTLTSAQAGSSYTPTLTTSATGYWLDYGATCSTANPLSGSGPTERWDTGTACPSVSSTQTIVFDYHHQYQQFLSYLVNYGGSGYSAPTASGLQLGSAYAPTLTTSSAGYWFDATGAIAFTNPLGGSNSTNRWYTTTDSVSATVQGSNSIVYYHQHHLAINGGNSIVIGTPSPTSDNWYYPTQSTTVSSDWVWNTVSGQSRMAITNYQIDGVYQNPTRANSGTLTVTVTFTTDPIVTFDTTTQYYLTVNGGDGITYGTPSPTADN